MKIKKKIIVKRIYLTSVPRQVSSPYDINVDFDGMLTVVTLSFATTANKKVILSRTVPSVLQGKYNIWCRL